MKKTLFAIAIVLTAGVAGAADLVEAIIVRVGDRIVTRTQYTRRMRDAMNEIEQTAPPDRVAARKEEVRKTLLDDIIAELLIKDRADRLGLSVTDAETKDAIERLKKQYNISSDEQFEQSLRSTGLTRAEMEARLRDTLIQNKVFARELRPREELTDRELRERYDREKDAFRLPERTRLRTIIIARPDDPAAALRAEERATEIARQARANADFAKLAASTPENVLKDKAGDLGEVARGELLPDLDKAVFNASAGAVLGPIATKSGWHIIKVEQRLPSEVPAFESVKEKLRKDVSEEAFTRDYKAYIERLRKEAYIQVHEENVPKV